MVKPVRATKQIELHDTAVRTFVRQLLVTDPRPNQSGDVPIPVVYATPERAYAAMAKLMEHLTGEIQSRDRFAKYPFISYHRTNILELDPMRHNWGWMGSSMGWEGNPFPRLENVGSGDGSTTQFLKTLDKLPVLVSGVEVLVGTTVVATDDGVGVISGTGVTGTINYTSGAFDVTITPAPAAAATIDARYKHNAREISYFGKWPFPYNFRYVADFWVRHQESVNEIAENFAAGYSLNRFNPYEVFLDVDYGTPWGVKIVPVTEWNFIDNSDLVDGAVEHDRGYRITLEFLMKGWLHLNPPDDPPRVYSIHQINTEFFLVDPGAGFDPLTRTIDLTDPTGLTPEEILIVDTDTIAT